MVFPHTHSKNPLPLLKFTPKITKFHQNPQTLNFPLFFNENHISPKSHHLSNPISTKPLFHNTFPPSLTQNLTKSFHKFTLSSQLSSLYKGHFYDVLFLHQKIAIQLFSKSKIFKPSTENNTCV